MHVGFVYISLPQFLMAGLTDVLIFVIGHIYVNFVIIGASLRHDGWCIWFREGRRCLGHDLCLIYIFVHHAQIPFQFIHCPGKNC